MRTDLPHLINGLPGRFAALAVAASLLVFSVGTARAVNLNVEIDQAKLVELKRPAAEVIIGNPSIADVTVQSGKLLVITGKSAGLTNLMALDGAGKLIYDKKVFVSADKKRLVTVSKGAARATFSCTPQCDPSLTPGDSLGHFEPLAKGIRDKIGLTQSTVDGTTAQQ